MVSLYNVKIKDYLSIYIEITTETKGSYKDKHTYTAEYLESINFNIDICKADIRRILPDKTHKRDVCKIVNHVVASINDYKKYLDDKKTNDNK
jgi:hypothetical protein